MSADFLFDPTISSQDKFIRCRDWFLRWSAANLPKVRQSAFGEPIRPDQLTLVAYTFYVDETRFERVEFGILQTWRTLGKYPLVIVTDRETETVEKFRQRHRDACKVVVSPDLKAGDLVSMSYDCIVNLHKYFTTPYCLIVQDDGFPIRSGIEDFLGKWDYVGAPFVRDKPWQFIADWLLMNCENGGFCLRSRRCCKATAERYEALKGKIDPDALKLEDWFYCKFARQNLLHRFRYRFASAKEARRFSVIDVVGLIDIHTLKQTPLGIHGPTTIWQYRHFLKDAFGYVIPA